MEMSSLFGIGAASYYKDIESLAEQVRDNAFGAYDLADARERGDADPSEEDLASARRRAIESAKALLQELRFRAESLDRAIKRTEGMSHV